MIAISQLNGTPNTAAGSHEYYFQALQTGEKMPGITIMKDSEYHWAQFSQTESQQALVFDWGL